MDGSTRERWSRSPRDGAGAVLAVAVMLVVALAGCSFAGPAGSPPSTTASPEQEGDIATTDESASVATAGPPTEAAPAAAAVPLPMFTSSIAPISAELAERMSGSWRPGCPVPLEDLRYVTVTHVDFAGGATTGEMVVHADVAESVVQVFETLFAERYPVRVMRLVDDFGADDTTSMEADNTSAFNCRAITGGTGWSEHAYGRAIDLNPVENPYVVGDHVAPDAGRTFVHRPDLPGVIHADDVVVRAFAEAGWHWGGYWTRPVDYQHFSVSGR